MQILDDLRLFKLGGPGIQKPCLGIVGIAYLKERRLLHKVDLESMLVAGCKGISLDLVVK